MEKEAVEKEKQNVSRIVLLPTQEVNGLSANLQATIKMATVKQDYKDTFIDVSILYPLIKDDAMLLMEFYDLFYKSEKNRKSR